MLTFRHPNTGHDHHINVDTKSFNSVAKFIHLGATVTNENRFIEDIVRRSNVENICYCALQIVFFRVSSLKHED
jgi:hypothetical protein